ncbi:GCN5 family N-acetyltransferase [Methylosinus sp. C49]|uniref:GNAT family N-acetyltransferase n=1 Tax=Methylosinus sp. C49 TaxID=2699395 RepID=UPI0013670769|nr:N-acetyltransferase [Methylosinus sp. C49]BBU62533.1 GCN5 family N-acetyltransferase [Methylosinus sp. C49]
MLIRDESAADRVAVRDVHSAAFRDHPFSKGREGELVDALREAGALTISLVAEADFIVGHVAISPVAIDGAALGWFGLGPIAVLSEHRRQGVAAALIEAGLTRLRAAGAAGCVVFGEPKYYGRFGFRSHAGLRFAGGPPELFMALPLAPMTALGAVDYHPAFALVG